MMNERGKSDPAVVAAKLANRRSDPPRSRWSQGLGPRGMQTSNTRSDAEPGNRATGAGVHTSNRKTAICRHSPEVGAVCGKAARTDLCGGRGAISVPTATDLRGAPESSAIRGTADVPVERAAIAVFDPK